MRIDVDKIDTIIGKLQALKLLASDPDIAPLLADSPIAPTTKNSKPHTYGHGEHPTIPAPAPPVETASVAEIAPRLNQKAEVRRGELTQAVIDSIPETAEFSGYDLVEEMKKTGFRFTAAHPAIAVNGVLRRLIGSLLHVVRQGKGSLPSIYKRVENALEEFPSTPAEFFKEIGQEEQEA
ncbi:MAG: hypothetical protein SGI92_11340 [Bryobacteraceae bacterium]|nr:hypothetical protein [Bryobacteraceae bacterium]